MAGSSMAASAADAVPANPRPCGGDRGRSLDRYRFRGCVSRRGGRTSHRRAIWHARAGSCGDCHRGSADRFCHDCRSDWQSSAGSRHGVCRGDDRLQRDRRAMPAMGRRPPSRTGVSASWRERSIGRAGGAHDPDPCSAERRDDHARPVLQYVTARLRRLHLLAALWLVCICSNRPSPRLFSRKGCRQRRSARVSTFQQDRCCEFWAFCSPRSSPLSVWPRP